MQTAYQRQFLVISLNWKSKRNDKNEITLLNVRFACIWKWNCASLVKLFLCFLHEINAYVSLSNFPTNTWCEIIFCIYLCSFLTHLLGYSFLYSSENIFPKTDYNVLSLQSIILLHYISKYIYYYVSS